VGVRAVRVGVIRAVSLKAPRSLWLPLPVVGSDLPAVPVLGSGGRPLLVPVAGRFPLLGDQPVPGSRFPVPGSRFPVPGSRFPVPGSRFPVPGSRNRFSWFRYPFWILFLAVLRWVTQSGLLVFPLLLRAGPGSGGRPVPVAWRSAGSGSGGRLVCRFQWPAGSGGGRSRFRWPATTRPSGRPPLVGPPRCLHLSYGNREFRTRDDGSPAPRNVRGEFRTCGRRCGGNPARAGKRIRTCGGQNPHVRDEPNSLAPPSMGTSARQPFLGISASICS
jgi:hypothetical protein